MEELLQAIKNDYKAFEEEAEVHVGRGNASAGIRARKLSMQIAEKLKQFHSPHFAASLSYTAALPTSNLNDYAKE